MQQIHKINKLALGKNFQLRRSGDLDLDLLSGHTTYRHAWLSDLCRHIKCHWDRMKVTCEASKQDCEFHWVRINEKCRRSYLNFYFLVQSHLTAKLREIIEKWNLTGENLDIVLQLKNQTVEEIDLDNRRISNSQGLMTWTLDWVTWQQLWTSTHRKKFIWIGRTFCEWPYGQTSRLALLGQHRLVDLNVTLFFIRPQHGMKRQSASADLRWQLGNFSICETLWDDC